MEHIRELMKCFPKSFINNNLEFIPSQHGNCCFRLGDVKNKFDLEVKVVQYLSRGYKEAPRGKRYLNILHQEYMVDGFNKYLGTDLKIDIQDNYNNFKNPYSEIYTRLGNGINKELAIEFVKSRFDLKVLEKKIK